MFHDHLREAIAPLAPAYEYEFCTLCQNPVGTVLCLPCDPVVTIYVGDGSDLVSVVENDRAEIWRFALIRGMKGGLHNRVPPEFLGQLNHFLSPFLKILSDQRPRSDSHRHNHSG
jgi:hypothetical protein